MDDVFNDAQRNRLAIVLREFERSLRQLDEWLGRGDVQGGALYCERLELAPAQRAALRARMAAVLEEIISLGQALGLQPAQEDMSAKIAAIMSVHWSDLIDSRSGSLRRYGEVHPALGAIIDERLTWLAQQALELAQLAKSETDLSGERVQKRNGDEHGA